MHCNLEDKSKDFKLNQSVHRLNCSIRVTSTQRLKHALFSYYVICVITCTSIRPLAKKEKANRIDKLYMVGSGALVQRNSCSATQAPIARFHSERKSAFNLICFQIVTPLTTERNAFINFGLIVTTTNPLRLQPQAKYEMNNFALGRDYVISDSEQIVTHESHTKSTNIWNFFNEFMFLCVPREPCCICRSPTTRLPFIHSNVFVFSW